MAGKVVIMSQPYAIIEARHPGKWMVVRVVDAKKELGQFVCEADSFQAPELAEATRKETAQGFDVAIRFGGSLIPQGTIVAF